MAMSVAEYCSNCNKRTLRNVGKCLECEPNHKKRGETMKETKITIKGFEIYTDGNLATVFEDGHFRTCCDNTHKEHKLLTALIFELLNAQKIVEQQKDAEDNLRMENQRLRIEIGGLYKTQNQNQEQLIRKLRLENNGLRLNNKNQKNIKSCAIDKLEKLIYENTNLEKQLKAEKETSNTLRETISKRSWKLPHAACSDPELLDGKEKLVVIWYRDVIVDLFTECRLLIVVRN